MPIGLFSNLNLASGFGLLRAVRTKQSRPVDLRQAPIFARSINHIVPSAGLLSTSSKVMATSGSVVASGDMMVDSLVSNCSNSSGFLKPTGVFYCDRRYKMCLGAKVGMRSVVGKSCYGGQASFLHFDGRSVDTVKHFSEDLKRCRTLSSSCYSDGAVPEASKDGGSLISEQLSSLAISDEQEKPSHDILKLLSGACYMPHPAKIETGGEDAYFICEDEQVIGVADGVGGWADVGVNAGNYSRELMSNSVKAIRESMNGDVDPFKVLEKAHSETQAMGSSTACIIALKNQDLHAINLGDSGFIVVRDGTLIFESPVQQHGFNFTYQLENSDRSDLPSSGQIFEIPVVPGDVIVAGSDGLFDNLFSKEVASIVGDAVRENLSPEATAQKIAVIARERALDRKHRTPFSIAAQEAGFAYYGGKLDDLTVVVSFVSSSTANA